jgi:hypothetical protein
MPDVDESKVLRAMSELERDMDHIDENNPKHMAHVMKKMKDAMPAGMVPKELDVAIKRLEAGEDPEKIEADMGDVLQRFDGRRVRDGEGPGAAGNPALHARQWIVRLLNGAGHSSSRVSGENPDSFVFLLTLQLRGGFLRSHAVASIHESALGCSPSFHGCRGPAGSLFLSAAGEVRRGPRPIRRSQSGRVADGGSRPSTNVEAEIWFTRQALDELRRELEQSNARNAAAITSTLSLVESSLERMHQRHMESVQSSNRAILIVSATFAGVGFLCLILVSIVLMRAIGRFSEMAAVAPHHGPLLGSGQPVAALGPGAMIASHSSAAEEAANRFQSAIDQLQKRMVELEHGAQAGPSESARPRSNGDRASSPVKPTSESTTTTRWTSSRYSPKTSWLRRQPPRPRRPRPTPPCFSGRDRPY